MTPDDEFQRALASKRDGGVTLDVGVSCGVWMGGIRDDRTHEPFVYVGAASWESEAELSFLRDRAAVEALINRLREAADQAWGPAPAP